MMNSAIVTGSGRKNGGHWDRRLHRVTICAKSIAALASDLVKPLLSPIHGAAIKYPVAVRVICKTQMFSELGVGGVQVSLPLHPAVKGIEQLCVFFGRGCVLGVQQLLNDLIKARRHVQNLFIF